VHRIVSTITETNMSATHWWTCLILTAEFTVPPPRAYTYFCLSNLIARDIITLSVITGGQHDGVVSGSLPVVFV